MQRRGKTHLWYQNNLSSEIVNIQFESAPKSKLNSISESYDQR